MIKMKIVLTPNPYRDKQFRTVQQARKILEGCGVQTATCLPFDVDRDYELPKSIEFQDLNREIKDADMLVCFGGDGTILHASKLATAHNLPILGINIGTMGFIAELEAGELELLRRLPAGDYTIEPRSMIDVTVTGANGQRLLHETALNDAVVTKGAIARVVQVSVYCDNVEATSFSGDGVIIATPTGSTAYSLSAGGPVVDPAANLIAVTPICPHTLLRGSVILSPETGITVTGRTRDEQTDIRVTTDGKNGTLVSCDSEIKIKKSEYTAKIVKIGTNRFFDILETKLNQK